MYASFLEKANLRFAKGETTILEKTTAETQRGQIAIQLNQLRNDIDILQLHFQLLLNTTTIFVPAADNPKLLFNATFDSLAVSNHPQIKVLMQQKNISLVNTQLQKHKLLPDLNMGYNNQSIQGNGADNILYARSYRFSAVQLGIGVPLFFGAQKGKINAAKIGELISENDYQIGLKRLTTEYVAAYKNYQTQLQTVKYFEDTALPNANTIAKTANEQYANGDINYLEWTLLINNVVSIQSSYTDAVKDLNQTIIDLNFLTSNKF
jgi:cobalt-zinc-cadmium resistance protein CzcA